MKEYIVVYVDSDTQYLCVWRGGTYETVAKGTTSDLLKLAAALNKEE